MTTNTDVLERDDTDTSTLDQLRAWNNWDGSESQISQLFNSGDGTPVNRARRRRMQRNPRQYKELLTEAALLYGRVLKGRRYAAEQFQEAMTTSDFPSLFGDILDRQILAAYNATPIRWEMAARRATVRDFRQVKRIKVDGGEGILKPVAEQTEYPRAAVKDSAYEYSVAKYGRKMGISWESTINDDLDALRDFPRRLGRGARRTEEDFATRLYVQSTGPNSTYFSAGNKNLVTANPQLSIPGMQTAFTVLASQLDTDGEPIVIEGAVLVVPPALMVPALNMLNATQIWTAAGSGGASSDPGRPDQLQTANWMANKVQLMVNPRLPLIDTTHGSTAWYLFADPNGDGRPPMEVGFLAGHDQPETFQKLPNATRVGGGPAMPEDGDFDTDSIDYKVRHVVGGVLMDPKMGVASNGSGS